ncbi:MAG TPA: molybdopterin-dependent oxidoreductase [Gaiellaceae bacterium]|nr:molybdopterin-dependent oxidoreductase [Gaiellaceae bacterium]
MSSPELVTVVVDGLEVQVPKGLGLVEAAAAAGIEIPVFCYEPRIGPPIGACRMCLVEVEGTPKLQAGCTLTAQDGMVVRTAQTSEKAADGQESTLEFILVNHPLDCPVCDKGGECPLQDLTFRYGPGNTRMNFPKRTFDKPIPISPLIALDRERCILCYRCTRFSGEVAEDGQLIARNRGAQSVIATFEDEPYRGQFTGNVIELCPVGALTSSPYRFEARPWEIQNVPSVCGMCPVGCNISATTREGKVKRILSRNHPEVDGGWLCDKGRFAYGHLRAADRIADPLRKSDPRYEELSWDEALDEAESLIRGAGGRIVTALSGSETVELAYALGKLMRQGVGAHSAVLPEPVDRSLDAFRAPLSTIRDAQLVVVLGDEPVAERAPIVELWLKAARREGAEIVRQSAPDAALEQRLREAERAVLIASGADGAGLAQAAGLDREGSAAFQIPKTANGRGVSDGWSAAADEDAVNPEPIGLLIVSGDEAAADPYVRAMAEQAEKVIAIAMFRRLVAPWADLILPGTSYLERDGTYVNLEGRLQRIRRASIPPAPDEIAVLSRLAARFGVELSPHPSQVFEEVSTICYGGVPYGEVGEQAPLRPRVPASQVPVTVTGTRPEETGGPGFRLVTYRPLFSGPAVERVPELQFQRPGAEVELPRDAARQLGIANGQTVNVRSNGTSVRLRARLTRELPPGVARIPDEHAAGLDGRVEVSP